MLRSFVAILTVLLALTARADQGAIRKVLDRMETAVLAGDAESYLKFVLQDDPVFLKEQQNWAADLKRHKPAEFKLSIIEGAAWDGEQPSDNESQQEKSDKLPPQRRATTPGFGPDRALFKLKMSWRMGQSDGTGKNAPKKRDVSYPVEFVHKGNDWLYGGEAWEVMDQSADKATGFEGVRVFFASGLDDAATRVTDMMPNIREKIDTLFDNRIKRVQEVKLYSSMAHLQASIYLSYKDGLGGWNEPGESVKIWVQSRPSENVLAHEYGHVATFELWDTTDDSPWWILEGVAEYCAAHVAGSTGAGVDQLVTRWHRSGRLAQWKDISDFRKTPSRLNRQVYKQGEHFVRWLAGKAGERGLIRWITLQGQGKSLDEATMAVTGLTFEQADTDWREYVAKLADNADQEKEDNEGGQ